MLEFSVSRVGGVVNSHLTRFTISVYDNNENNSYIINSRRTLCTGVVFESEDELSNLEEDLLEVLSSFNLISYPLVLIDNFFIDMAVVESLDYSYKASVDFIGVTKLFKNANHLSHYLPIEIGTFAFLCKIGSEEELIATKELESIYRDDDYSISAVVLDWT